MTEQEWLECAEVFDLWDSKHVARIATARQYRLFATGCCRRVWHWMTDERARHAVETLDRLADALSAAAARAAALSALLRDGDPWAGREDSHARVMSAALLCAGANGCDDLRLAVEVAEECGAAVAATAGRFDRTLYAAEQKAQCDLARDLFGNPFRPVAFDPAWRATTALAIARDIYDDRAFDRLPILADALEDAGCTNEEILNHCRQPGEHVRGCWVVDLVLGKN